MALPYSDLGALESYKSVIVFNILLCSIEVFWVLEWLEPSDGSEFPPVMACIVKVVFRQLDGSEPPPLYIWRYSGVLEHFKYDHMHVKLFWEF